MTDLLTDPDLYGLYEDLNANGNLDFADLSLYFTEMGWIEENEQIGLFYYNGYGRIDFADITTLFHDL